MPDAALTPEQLARIDATVDRVAADRADAKAMASRYDAACRRMDELHAETTRLHRRAAALEDQIRDRDARIAELEEKVAAELEKRLAATPAVPTPDDARAAQDALGPLWETVVGPAVDYLQEHRAARRLPPLYGRDVAAVAGAVALAVQAYRDAHITGLEKQIAAQAEALSESAGEDVHVAPRCSDPAGAACCGVRLSLAPEAAALLAEVLAVHPHPILQQVRAALEVPGE